MDRFLRRAFRAAMTFSAALSKLLEVNSLEGRLRATTITLAVGQGRGDIQG